MVDTKINQLRNELSNIRNQRKTANAVHHVELRMRKRLQQWLQEKIHSLERKGVLPHETKSALDQAYTCTVAVHVRPLQCVVRQEAIWLATMRRLERMSNAKHFSQSMKNQIRKGMLYELKSLKHERTKMLVGFHNVRSAILVERETMRLQCEATLQHQREILEMLDPSRCMMGDTTTPSKTTNFFENPISFFKSTSSQIFQIASRTA